MLKPSLRTRFICYFLPLLFGTLLQGGYCIYTFSIIHNRFEQLQKDAGAEATTMLELKQLLRSLETGIKAGNIDRELISEKAAQLSQIISSHAEHKHEALSPPEQAAHETLHHTIFATTLSQYILEKSAAGWTADPDEFTQIVEAIEDELTVLETVIDQHLQHHLQQLARTEEFVSKKYQHTMAVVALTSMAVILLTAIIFMLMMRSVLGPVKQLQEGTRQIGIGNLNHRLEITSGDEFEFLAGEFGKMAEQLSRYHADLDLKVQERTKELLHANKELQRAEEQVHNLSQRILTVQEMELQQISLYLHDSVAQNLSSLKIAGGTLLREAVEGNMPSPQEVQEWSNLLDQCIKTVRELSYNLRPPGLEQIGLASAVADYCRDFSKKTGIAVRFSKAGVDNLPVAFEYAINIYRLVQEALNNIEKHAGATNVEVRLIASHPNVILRLEDNGCGFDPEEGYRWALENKRFGLLGMEERVRMMQGSFTLHSALGQGTKIIVEFPVTEPGDEPEHNEKIHSTE